MQESAYDTMNTGMSDSVKAYTAFGVPLSSGLRGSNFMWKAWIKFYVERTPVSIPVSTVCVCVPCNIC